MWKSLQMEYDIRANPWQVEEEGNDDFDPLQPAPFKFYRPNAEPTR